MWYNAREYSPGIIVVYAFIQPQKHHQYYDVFLMAYKDSDGTWRSTSGMVLPVLYWKWADNRIVPPDTYHYDTVRGWRKTC